MKFKRIVLGGITCIMAVALIACQAAPAPAEDAAAQEEVAPVEKSLEVFGVVKGDKFPVSFELEMKVLEKVAKTGDLVKKGDGLFKFDRAKMEQLAELKNLELLAASKKLGGSQVEGSKLRNTLSALEKDLAEKKQDYASQKKLFEGGMISKSELGTLETQIRSLETDIENAKLSLVSQGSSDSSLQASDQAEYKRIALQFTTYEELLSAGEWINGDQVITPFDEAIVSDFEISTHAYVEAKTVLLNLVDTKSLYIEAEVSEEFVKQVKLGDLADIKPLFDKEKLYHGKIVHISNMPYEKNGEMIVPIRIELTDRDGELLPNFNVDVKIYTE